MSDRISFRCPCCAARLSGPVGLAGRSGTCPRCRHRVAVPRLPTVRPAAPTRGCLGALGWDARPGSVTGLTLRFRPREATGAAQTRAVRRRSP